MRKARTETIARNKIDRKPGFAFKSSHPPKVGDKVRLGSVAGDEATVSEIKTERRGGGTGLVLHFSDRTGPWALWDSTQDSCCRLVKAGHGDKPKMPSAPMAKGVLKMLQDKGSLTGLEAGGVLKCRDLPKRISELRSLGWPITREMCQAPIDGQRYARYYLKRPVNAARSS